MMAQEMSAHPLAAGTWQHDLSTLKVAGEIGSFSRGAVNRYDQDGYNVSVQLEDTETQTIATIYVFRSGRPNVGVWADRAASVMLSNPALGKADMEQIIRGAFTPPNAAGADSGYRVVAGINGEGFRSTGAAIYNHDGWLLKIRMSSRTLSPQGLDETLMSIIAKIDMDAAKQPAPAFVQIEDCTQQLKTRKNAKINRYDMVGTILVGAAVGAAREAVRGSAAEAKETWCRDPSSKWEYGVYRADESEKSYLIAFGDAGVSAEASNVNFSGLVKPSRGYMLSVSDGVTEEVYPILNRLPKPAQIAELLGKLSPISTFDVRPGAAGEQTIVIPSGK